MTLVKATLKQAIETAFKAQSSKTENPAEALSDLAEQLATAIDAYIKSGTVTTVVTGSSASGGPVTGAGTGGIT